MCLLELPGPAYAVVVCSLLPSRAGQADSWDDGAGWAAPGKTQEIAPIDRDQN
jgi:hypothetical protein